MQKEMFQWEALKGGSAEAQRFIESKREGLEREIQRFDTGTNAVKTQAEKFAAEEDLFKSFG